MKCLRDYICESKNDAKIIIKDIQKYMKHTDTKGVPFVSPKEQHDLYKLFKELVEVAGNKNVLDFNKKLYVNYKMAGLVIDDDVLKIKTFWGDDRKLVYFLELFEKGSVNIAATTIVKLEHFWDYVRTEIFPNVK